MRKVVSTRWTKAVRSYSLTIGKVTIKRTSLIKIFFVGLLLACYSVRCMAGEKVVPCQDGGVTVSANVGKADQPFVIRIMGRDAGNSTQITAPFALSLHGAWDETTGRASRGFHSLNKFAFFSEYFGPKHPNNRLVWMSGQEVADMIPSASTIPFRQGGVGRTPHLLISCGGFACPKGTPGAIPVQFRGETFHVDPAWINIAKEKGRTLVGGLSGTSTNSQTGVYAAINHNTGEIKVLSGFGLKSSSTGRVVWDTNLATKVVEGPMLGVNVPSQGLAQTTGRAVVSAELKSLGFGGGAGAATEVVVIGFTEGRLPTARELGEATFLGAANPGVSMSIGLIEAVDRPLMGMKKDLIDKPLQQAMKGNQYAAEVAAYNGNMMIAIGGNPYEDTSKGWLQRVVDRIFGW